MAGGGGWVCVLADEQHGEPVEVQAERDNTLSLASVAAQFPGATGLQFRHAGSGALRGVRQSGGDVLHCPHADGDWGDTRYVCVFPKEQRSSSRKRAAEHESESSEGSSSKTSREEPGSDLIVLGLAYKTTEEGMRKYFETFGELHLAQLKLKPNGKSKGFGFVRFKSTDVQKKVLMQRHMIDDRWCDVRVPESLEPIHQQKETNCKIFVARIVDSITETDLREHFEQFGAVTDVFLPKPFRGFAFVTFVEAKVAQSLAGKDHLINGTSVHIGIAAPRPKNSDNGGGGSYDNSFGGGFRGRGRGRGRNDYRQRSFHDAGGGGYDSYGNFGGGNVSGFDSWSDGYGGSNHQGGSSYGGRGGGQWNNSFGGGGGDYYC